MHVVVPAYNEEENIAQVIMDIKSNVREVNIVVVDDGSDDRTAQIAKNFGATVLSHVINRGQGAALQTGTSFSVAQGADIIAHFDADGQFSAYDINTAIDILKNNSGIDVVFGSRFLKSGGRAAVSAAAFSSAAAPAGIQRTGASAIPFTKKWILLPAARAMNYFFTGVKLTDAHNGFRVLTGFAAKKIRITQDKMAHNSQIVEQVKRAGLKWVEIPVTVKYKEYGQGMRAAFIILKDLILGKIL